jgi:hypothetical protein
MLQKVPSPLPGHVRVIFELPSCVWADRIFLVGDFNAWNEQATPMKQERDGVWRATVDLAQGTRCEFRYQIDGQWQTDYHADGFAGNSYGSDNSVVHAVLPQDAQVIQRRTSLVCEGAPKDSSRDFGRHSPLATTVKSQPITKLHRPARTTFVPAAAA